MLPWPATRTYVLHQWQSLEFTPTELEFTSVRPAYLCSQERQCSIRRISLTELVMRLLAVPVAIERIRIPVQRHFFAAVTTAEPIRIQAAQYPLQSLHFVGAPISSGGLDAHQVQNTRFSTALKPIRSLGGHAAIIVLEELDFLETAHRRHALDGIIGQVKSHQFHPTSRSV